MERKIGIVILVVMVVLIGIGLYRKNVQPKATAGATAKIEEQSTTSARPERSANERRVFVSGILTTKSTIEIPEKTNIQIELADISNPAKPVVYGGQNIITRYQSLPLSFEIGYNTAGIKQESIYVVNARVIIDGKVVLKNTKQYKAITGGNPTEKIEVELE